MTKQNHTDGKVPKDSAEPDNADGVRSSQAKPDGEDAAGRDRDLDLGAIGSQLRGLYRELLDEPIPDRFTELLKDLEGKETGQK